MKLLKLLSMLILIVLGSFAKSGRNRNPKKTRSEVSEQHINPQDHSAYDRTNPIDDRINTIGDIKSANIQPETDSQQKSRDIQQTFWERQLTLAKWLNGITVFAGIVGFLGLIAIYYTLKATQEAAEAAKAQAISSQTATDIAKLAFDENVRTFRLDQRAWVGVKEIILRGQMRPGSELFAVIQQQNTGKTPALEVTINHTVTYKKPTKELLDKFPKIGTFGKIAMAPNGTFASVQIFSLNLNEAEIKKINEGNPYVYGRIFYKDVFGESHQTWFCSFYSPDIFPALRFCDTLNYMD
jgi:hypothetical protein